MTVVFTVIEATIDAVMSPSMLSRAVAPASVYTVPPSIARGLVPMSVMTGAVVSGTRMTFTVRVAVAVFADASVET